VLRSLSVPIDHPTLQSHGYPRPQLERPEWTCLNGTWDFALDPKVRWTRPEQVLWDQAIEVPFAPETPASGVHNTGFFRSCWYRRQFEAPALGPGQRLLLHFGAVDTCATVWVNGMHVADHEGGYTPFHVDITDHLTPEGPQTVVVRAEDDPYDLAKPRGKQDWQLEPHSIWYPRTTGIWQTVWLERVAATRLQLVRWTPCLERWEIALDTRVEGGRRGDLRLHVRLHVGEMLLADDTYAVVAGEVHRRIALSDPGIDDYRNELLWSPTTPTLIEAELELRTEGGQLLDSVRSYTALRAIGVQGDRFVLNGRPYPLRMVLDQGYWPDTGLTPPNDAALRRDVELARAMGFNGVRKHQKIEDPRYLYWADVLGLLVWEEMPSAYRYTKESIERLTREWTEAIMRDISHPCIVAWVPFNESWGVPDLPDSPAQRHYVQALYHLTKTLDPSRPVVGNDGWESVATDIIGIHDYDDRPERIAARYGTDEPGPRLFQRERPGGRMLVLDAGTHGDQPVMLTEFGGIAYAHDESGTWGYSRSASAEEFARKYTNLLAVVRSLPLLAGFCYTQFADTYQEANGLLYADRTPKFPLAEIAQATAGQSGVRDRHTEWAWRERLMNSQRGQYLVPTEDYQMQDDR
jgi:beta-galactosidase/beta-glucuronidase